MKIKRLEVTKKFIAGILLTASAISLGGCGKTSDCEVQGYHLHRYEKYGIVRYLSEEELEWRGYNWLDQIEFVDYQEQLLREYEKKKGLIRIEDNIDYLMELEQELQDFTEYRYSYTRLKAVPMGKTTITMPQRKYSWTRDKNHGNLTGETRTCHYVYIGYKVLEDNGKYTIVESEPVDSLLAIKDEFPYFKEVCYKVVNKDDSKDADYEDGPEEKAAAEDLKAIEDIIKKNM